MPARPRHWARRTHRVLGVSALLFLVILALTGLLLNHTDALGLAGRSAASPLLLRLYGMETVDIGAIFEADGHRFVSANGKLYVDGRETVAGVDSLTGAARARGEIIVATSRALLLMTESGQVIERFVPELEAPINRLGIADDTAIIESGERVFAIDTGGMRLREASRVAAAAISWSKAQHAAAAEVQAISSAVLGETLSWERVLLDLHSGRLLPVAGRYIADLAALCLLYLCITGGILWFRKR